MTHACGPASGLDELLVTELLERADSGTITSENRWLVIDPSLQLRHRSRPLSRGLLGADPTLAPTPHAPCMRCVLCTCWVVNGGALIDAYWCLFGAYWGLRLGGCLLLACHAINSNSNRSSRASGAGVDPDSAAAAAATFRLAAVAAAVRLKADLKQIRRQEKANAGPGSGGAAADARVVCTDGGKGKAQSVLLLSHSGVQLKIKRDHYAKLRELYRVSQGGVREESGGSQGGVKGEPWGESGGS